jgi:hypothetical protein
MMNELALEDEVDAEVAEAPAETQPSPMISAGDEPPAEGEREWKIGDVISETDKGRMVVVGFYPDGRLKKRHQIKPRFGPGVSGNPLGPKKPGERNLFAYIQRKSKGGRELADFAFKVIRGEVERTSVRDRLTALQWLTDRGYGKAMEKVDVTSGGQRLSGATGGPLGALTLAELGELTKLARATTILLPSTTGGDRGGVEREVPRLLPADPVAETGGVPDV